MNEKAKAAARDIARRVMERERSLETEIAETASLTLEVLGARRTFRAGVEINQEPLELLAERQRLLIGARGAGAALHKSLIGIGALLDEELDFGCQRGCGLLGSARAAARLPAT